MDRRTFLAISGAAGAGLVGGCLSDPVPDGMTIETRHWVADVLVEGIWYRRQEEGESVGRYYELVPNGEAAQNRIDGDAEVEEFVRGTDFERSYLLVVQNMMQSARWLELGTIERTDDGIDVAVTTESPDEPYGDDAAVHSLAIRVTDEQAGVPDELDVRIDTEPVEAGRPATYPASPGRGRE